VNFLLFSFTFFFILIPLTPLPQSLIITASTLSLYFKLSSSAASFVIIAVITVGTATSIRTVDAISPFSTLFTTL